MSEFIPPEQNDLYVRALKALNKAGRQSEHHKPATTKEEIELMKQTNQATTSSTFSPPVYRNGQYELIFANPLSRTAWLVNHDLDGNVPAESIQMWQSPAELLTALREGTYEDSCIA